MNMPKLRLPNMKKRTQRILTLSALLAAVAALLAAGFFMKNKDSIRIEGQFRVSMLGEHTDFSGKCRMRYDDKSKEVTLQSEERSMLLSGLPVYSLTEDLLYTSGAVSYYDFEQKRVRRLNRFAAVYMDDGAAFVSPDGKREFGAKGYLFNGKNIYVFLEPVSIEYGGERLSLSPLSFVSAMGEQGFYYYDREKKTEGFVNGISDTLYGRAERGGFVLNMSNDTVTLPDGRNLLLSPSPETFPVLE